MDLRRQGLLHIGGQGVATVVGAAGVLLLAAAFGAGVFGTYSIILAVSMAAAIPVGAIAGAVEKRMSESGEGEYIGSGAVLSACVLMVLLGGLAVLSQPLETYVNASVWFIAAILVGRSIGSLVSSAFIGRGFPETKGLLDGVHQIVWTSSIGVVVFLDAGLSGIVIAHAGSEIGVWTIAALARRNVLNPAWPSRLHLRRTAGFARYFWLNVLRVKGFKWTDTLVLGFFVSPVLVGIYELAWRMANLLGVASMSVRQVALPAMSTNLDDTDDVEHLRVISGQTLVYAGVLTIPGLVGALVLGERLFVPFGADFVTEGSWIVLTLLVIGKLFSVYGDQLVNSLNAIDRADVGFRINGILVGLNVVLNIILVWQFGWFGAALATAGTGLTGLVISYLRLADILGEITLQLRSFLSQWIAASVMGLVVIFLVVGGYAEGTVGVVSTVGLGSFIYFSVLVALDFKTYKIAVFG